MQASVNWRSTALAVISIAAAIYSLFLSSPYFPPAAPPPFPCSTILQQQPGGQPGAHAAALQHTALNESCLDLAFKARMSSANFARFFNAAATHAGQQSAPAAAALQHRSMTIAIAMVMRNGSAPYYAKSLANKQAYARRHGYHLRVYDKLDASRSTSWSKVATERCSALCALSLHACA